MPRIPIKFADLKQQLFMEGTNLGFKIGADKQRPVKIQYDTDWQCLLVEFNGKASMVPFPSIGSMMPTNYADVFTVLVQPVAQDTFVAQDSGGSATTPVFPTITNIQSAQVSEPTKPAEGRTGRGARTKDAA